MQLFAQMYEIQRKRERGESERKKLRYNKNTGCFFPDHIMMEKSESAIKLRILKIERRRKEGDSVQTMYSNDNNSL